MTGATLAGRPISDRVENRSISSDSRLNAPMRSSAAANEGLVRITVSSERWSAVVAATERPAQSLPRLRVLLQPDE